MNRALSPLRFLRSIGASSYLGLALFLILAGEIVLGGFYFSENREKTALDRQESRLAAALSDTESVLTSLAIMQEKGTLPVTPDRFSLFRAYRIQAMSALSAIARKGVLESPEEIETYRGLLSLFSYSAYSVATMRSSRGGTSLLPEAVQNRMVGMTLSLWRLLKSKEQKTLILRQKIHHLQTTTTGGVVLLMVLFFFLFLIFWKMEDRTIRVLHFELRLIERFIITSNVITDWKEHVRKMLADFNEVIGSYFLFSLFVTREEVYELDIFWRARPSENTKTLMHQILDETIRNHPEFRSLPTLTIYHNILDPDSPLPEIDLSVLRLSTKTLILESPKVGGIAGVGIHSGKMRDMTGQLVVESLLTTVINVLGSVKAMYLYTKEIEYYASRDPLTGLHNQRIFWDLMEYEAERALRHNVPSSLLLIDCDNFKRINDTYGHAVGDLVLQALARLLEKACRTGDLVCRYGGDEFAVIASESDMAQARGVAERIQEEVRKFRVFPPDLPTPVTLTVSVGIATYPIHAKKPRDLFVVADHMMYRAKKLGRDLVVEASEDDVAEAFRAAGENQVLIINAIKEKRIVPVFQPILALSSETLYGYEVLSRITLSDDDPTLIPASEFIETVEEAGLIARMDYLSMEKAFSEIVRIGFRGPVFVNLSPRSLIIADFLATVTTIVRIAGISPHQIVFEITERETVRNLRLLEKFIQNLKLNGFRFAIDDFGAGYASLNYLRFFPVDFLKIEGDFIRGLAEESPVNQAILRSIVTLANSLGIPTIGEYVEDATILERARDIGIHYGQGYHLGHPGMLPPH